MNNKINKRQRFIYYTIDGTEEMQSVLCLWRDLSIDSISVFRTSDHTKASLHIG